jgi:ABC-type multidrug transport system fused ATPase/permease subunit
MPILRQAVAKASEFGTVLGSGLVSLNLVLMSKVLAPFIWISSIGVSKMASRIINSGLADAHEASLQILLIFMILYFVGLCVIFRLFHFHISIKVPKQHSRQCKSQFDLAVMEEHQRNGQSDLCIQLGLEK